MLSLSTAIFYIQSTVNLDRCTVIWHSLVSEELVRAEPVDALAGGAEVDLGLATLPRES